MLQRLSRSGTTLADALAAAESDPVLAGGFSSSSRGLGDLLDERDRALCNELVLGTLRRRGWLDHVLGPLLDRPLDQLSAGILDVLRLGSYQLLFTRVAQHAALSESVELARTVEPRATGFVNAVLRRLQRQGPPAEPDARVDPQLWLTTWGSLPAWLAERWLHRLGPERAIARARALLTPPATHFRLNPRVAAAPRRLEEAEVRFLPTWVPGALRLLEGRLTPLAEEGVVYAQDAGSQLVAHLAASPGRILDACAAPGGKSLLLADLGAPATRIVAAELSRRRLRNLQWLVRRWGAERVALLAADARRPPFRDLFDAVLLDAPCSGLGTLARHPDIRWRIRPADVARHAQRQRELVESLAPWVRPGGHLVYATCSVEPEENEGVLSPFLATHPEFAPDDLPAWVASHRDGAFVRIEPSVDGDGFFVARLRREAR